jgi:hypothetical protein
MTEQTGAPGRTVGAGRLAEPMGLSREQDAYGREVLTIRTIGGYLSLGQAAELFGITEVRLRKAVERGHLPTMKSGPGAKAFHLVRIADVTKYLDTGYLRRRRDPRSMATQPRSPRGTWARSRPPGSPPGDAPTGASRDDGGSEAPTAAAV